MKTFILDTNVLLHNSYSLFSFGDNRVVIPLPVIEELDKFKKSNDELGRNARWVIRRLDGLRTKGNLGDGVQMENGGTLCIVSMNGHLDTTGLDAAVKDNRIIALADQLRKAHVDREVIIVSKDVSLRMKAK